MQLQPVKCENCGKLLCEASGEVRKKCPACKKITHIVATSEGIFSVPEITQVIPKQASK